VIFGSLFELWSMGIWLGYLTEPRMADTLSVIVLVDIACNCLYIVDSLILLARVLLDERENAHRAQFLAEKRLRAAHKAAERAATMGRKIVDYPGASRRVAGKRGGRGCDWWWDHLGTCGLSLRYFAKVFLGPLLVLGMLPVQLLLYSLLQAKEYVLWQVLLVLAFRMGRVVWAFRDCAAVINQQEMEVYVDIRMHGTSGSSWNKVRIVAKQLLIVVFCGHWLGCLAYTLRKVGAPLQEESRMRPDMTRDYFVKFQDECFIAFQVGADFWQSYLLSLYKGFNLNYEDLLPERPLDLCLEVAGSIIILMMKSYCIGGFFKYHQKREFEVQRFSQLMRSVTQFLDTYEVPPSLRKTIISHFRFQQANHRKIKTLEVLGQLSGDIQRKLKEFEVFPIVVERNYDIFGNGVSSDFAMHISMMLVSQFLQPGEVLFLEGDVPRELVFLDSGAVGLSRSTMSEGRLVEQLIRYIRADRKEDATLIGGVPLILGCPHFFSARVRAGSEAVTLTAPLAAWDAAIAAHPDQLDILIRNVAAAHLLDVQGKDLPGAHRTSEEGEFVAAQNDVRSQLVVRQESNVAIFTYAASTGNVKIVKELLAKRIEANVADYDRRSAMHLAASEGMTVVLETLLQAHGDANFRDRWGSTPMQDCLKNGFVAAAKLVRRYGGELMLDDPAAELCGYASKGDTIQMQQLVDFGIDLNSVDYDSRTAMHLSAAEGHLPVITFLTSCKANVNAKDRWGATPLEDAIRNGFAVVVRHLNQCGGQVRDEMAAELLCTAASDGDLPTLRQLFESNVDMDQGDYDARTAMHLAAAEGQLTSVSFLIGTALAHHSPVDRWQSTPFQDAIAGGHELVVQVLMAAGAELGPSATPAELQKVEELSRELGFDHDKDRLAFCRCTGSLRRSLATHIRLVESGHARSDSFDKEKASRFNHLLVNRQVESLRTMCESAQWLLGLLEHLEIGVAAAGPALPPLAGRRQRIRRVALLGRAGPASGRGRPRDEGRPGHDLPPGLLGRLPVHRQAERGHGADRRPPHLDGRHLRASRVEDLEAAVHGSGSAAA